MRQIIRNNQGFTWVELIVVMVILGIISAVVLSGMVSSDTELAARTEVIKTHLRYAQSRAMNSNTVWYIKFSGNSYSLYKKDGGADPTLLPGADSSTVVLPGSISIDYGIIDVVSFDGLGKPCTDSSAQVAQASDRSLTITAGSDSRIITITKNTGFIQ